MEHADLDKLPFIYQVLVTAFIGASVLGGIVFAYFKNKGSSNHKPDDAVVVSATFSDRKSIENLVDSQDRLSKALDRNTDKSVELCDEVHDLNRQMKDVEEVIKANTDGSLNLLNFMKSRNI